MYDDPDDLLNFIRTLGRMRVGVRRGEYDGIPDYYHPLKSWKTRGMIEDELSMRVDHLLYRYAEMTGEKYDPEEYRDSDMPVMEFTMELVLDNR